MWSQESKQVEEVSDNIREENPGTGNLLLI